LEILWITLKIIYIYIVGSSILYALDETQQKEKYEKSDVDILIDTETWEEFDIEAKKIIGENKFERIEGRRDSYKYIFYINNKKAEIFRSKIGTIVGYHVPMVRGAYNNDDFIVTPSLINAIKTKLMWEYRWVKAHAGVIDVLFKYADRGYKIILSPYEYEILNHIKIHEKFCIISALYDGFPYIYGYPTIKKAVAKRVKKKFDFIINKGGKCVQSKLINVDNVRACICLESQLVILDPGESHIVHGYIYPKMRSIKNPYLSNILKIDDKITSGKIPGRFHKKIMSLENEYKINTGESDLKKLKKFINGISFTIKVLKMIESKMIDIKICNDIISFQTSGKIKFVNLEKMEKMLKDIGFKSKYSRYLILFRLIDMCIDDSNIDKYVNNSGTARWDLTYKSISRNIIDFDTAIECFGKYIYIMVEICYFMETQVYILIWILILSI
jgi:hypothetical protein